MKAFQSTLPARGATSTSTILFARISNFNPRSPHGERQSYVDEQDAALDISIHAPRTGSDFNIYDIICKDFQFQSTLPARGATGAGLPNQPGHDISIHAPRTGSDNPPGKDPRGHLDFNPRSPHGERLPPHRGRHRPRLISIHAPRTGSDLAQGYQINPATIFQSTLPARGATGYRFERQTTMEFQSTLPARGATKISVHLFR